MRNFYSPLKDCEPYIRFTFFTGITKFSQLSIFSELNNIVNVSMDANYADVCGFTETELRSQIPEAIAELAGQLRISQDEALSKLKANYDGYHFTWPSADIYNPYSIINCFASNKIDAYWFSSGTPTYIIEMMKKFGATPTKLGDEIQTFASEFDTPMERMSSIIPLLYQSGYLTIKDYDKETDLYTLAIPNKEIRTGLFSNLLPNYLEHNAEEGRIAIAQMSIPIKKGDMDSALTMLRKFLATIPYCDNTHFEGHYQQMLYLLFALLTNYRIIVKQRTAKGRMDITLETDNYIYIIELKFGRTASKALQQINSSGYPASFATSNKKIIKVGINFDIQNERNIMEWKIE